MRWDEAVPTPNSNPNLNPNPDLDPDPNQVREDGNLDDRYGKRVHLLGAVRDVLYELKTDARWEGAVTAVASCTDEPECAMHTSCTRHAHAMHTPCTCHAGSGPDGLPSRLLLGTRLPAAQVGAGVHAQVRGGARRQRRVHQGRDAAGGDPQGQQVCAYRCRCRCRCVCICVCV